MTLCDPKSGGEWPALAPGAAATPAPPEQIALGQPSRAMTAALDGSHPAPAAVVRDLVRLPQWWTPSIEAAWIRSRDAALTDWCVQGDHSTRVDATAIEHALAFGHGARSAYSHETSWDEVCPQLRADWSELGHVGPASWERVVDVIRHEWVRAAGPGGDAAPDQ